VFWFWFSEWRVVLFFFFFVGLFLATEMGGWVFVEVFCDGSYSFHAP